MWSLQRPLPAGSQAGWDWPNTHGQGEQLRKSMLDTVELFKPGSQYDTTRGRS